MLMTRTPVLDEEDEYACGSMKKNFWLDTALKILTGRRDAQI